MRADGAEILSYFEGEAASGAPLPDYVWSDDNLASVVRLLRQLHQITRGWSPSHRDWKSPPIAPDGDIICHNDAAPWNTRVPRRPPSGFIDWDMAGPGTALSELGYVAWHWVRLWPDRGAREHGFEPLHERKRRLAAVAVAYGDVTSQARLAAAGEHQRAWLRQVTAGVAAGIDAYRILLESGSIEGVHEDMEFVEHTRTELLDV